MPRSFKLLRTLGEGAFGAVHLAEVRSSEGFVQTLAVKWLLPHWSEDPELARRLRDEARLLALLQHDNIVRVHGLTRIDGRLAILMEPVQGADLSVVGDEPIPPRAAMEIVEAVADALYAAWELTPPGAEAPLRVVHRDIKPSNIMVTARGSVKVMDFGVARATFDAREAHTRSQQFGTARYMAPERWLDGIAEAPSDIFSLGVTLIEVISGAPMERPRLSKASYDEDIARALALLEPWPSIQALASEMVRFEPGERPTSADVVRRCAELAEGLEGPGLRRWADDWVPRHEAAHSSSGVSGTEVAEDGSGETFDVASRKGDVETAPYPVRPPPQSGGTDATTVSLFAGRRGWVLYSGIAVILVAAGIAVGGTAVDTRSTPRSPDDTEVAGTPDPEPEVPTEVAPAPIAKPEIDAVPDEVPSEVPVAEPVPVPVVTPVAPAVAPRPVPVVVPDPPAPVPVVVPAVAPEVPRTAVTFILEPSNLVVTTEHGAISSRRAILLPHGLLHLRATLDDHSWTCTVPVDEAGATWRVDHSREQCDKAH